VPGLHFYDDLKDAAKLVAEVFDSEAYQRLTSRGLSPEPMLFVIYSRLKDIQRTIEDFQTNVAAGQK
jgi:hypothetical protein